MVNHPNRMKKLEFCDEATKEAARVAFLAGGHACIDGVDLQRGNPYKSGSWDDLERRKHNQWRYGWGEAKSWLKTRAIMAVHKQENEEAKKLLDDFLSRRNNAL
jgi:hypothetical protein